jgi:hypothetical protein
LRLLKKKSSKKEKDFFSVWPNTGRSEGLLSKSSMTDIVAPTPDAKRGRKKVDDGFALFFRAKVKTLLLRTRNVIQALPADIGGPAVALLADLDFFSDATSLNDVVNKLGGEDVLAAKVFRSVIDEKEKDKFLQFSKKRKPEHQKMVRSELELLVAQVQVLARQLPKNKSDKLVSQVLALPLPANAAAVEEDDSGGTREQESSKTDDKTPKKKKRGRSQKKAAAKPPPSLKEKSKSEKKKPKKQEKKVAEKSGAKKAVAEEEEEEFSLVDEQESTKHSNSLCKEDVARKLEEAEKEYDDIRALQAGGGAVPATPALDPPGEGPPNVEQVIESAKLDDARCLCETESIALDTVEARMSLQMWWRIANRACQIHGLFQKMREQKSKEATMLERYEKILAEQLADREGVLKYVQASKYDRLGKFLARFPNFIFQRKWITLADWLQKVDKDKALVDLIPSIVPLSSVFLRDSFKLHEHGFEVRPAVMSDCITGELISTCKTRCEKDGEIVFNNAKDPSSSRNDKKRMQLSLDKINDGEALERLKTQLRERLNLVLPQHKVDSMVALLAKSGCKAQLAHTDYSPKTLANVLSLEHDDKMPLSCLVALTDGTLLDVWPYAVRFDKSRTYKPMQIRLCAGDVLIFRGDLVHAGAAYGEEANVRIHAYLDVVGIERPKHGDGVEETHFMCDEKGIGGRMLNIEWK